MTGASSVEPLSGSGESQQILDFKYLVTGQLVNGIGKTVFDRLFKFLTLSHLRTVQ